MNPLNLMRLVAPECILVIFALTALFMDVATLREQSAKVRQWVVGSLSGVACLTVMIWIACIRPEGSYSMVELPAVSFLLKEVLLGLTLVTALISFDAKFTRHIGEYYALLLLAAVGLMLLISSNNLLMIFVAVELVSLSLYAMTALDKTSPASAEAALKYFLFGSVAAAFMLFGISLLYGVTGQLQLDAIAGKLQTQHLEPIHYVALVMTLTGFAFKIAAAPFHLWAPDVYQAAPTPIASFIASASKVGSFFVLARIVLAGFGSARGGAGWGHLAAGWVPVLAILATVSMVIGNLVAIVQTRVKRLLAYSAIAHGGYALMALLADEQRAVSSLLFYVITYAITVLGAFGVVAMVEHSGGRDRFSDFAGLSRRAPLLSFCMLVFLLSLAGIPPLSGFFGKFYVFTAAISGPDHLQAFWLLIVGGATSVVSIYYYLQVLKQIYVAPAPANVGSLNISMPAQIGIVALAIAVIVLGFAPGLLLGRLNDGLTLVASNL